MKLKIKKCLIIGSVLSSLCARVYSQELTPFRLSLDQAIEMGLQNHQQLKISEARLQTSEDQVRASKTQQQIGRAHV